MPLVRRAEPTDAGALADLAEQTFREAFASVNAPEDIALHCSTRYTEEIQGQEIADPSMTTLVCEDGGRLVGFAQLRWNGRIPVGVDAIRPLEIQRLYVQQQWHGRGVAQALMEEALRLAGAGGADRAWLGVWEHNARAIAFYRKYGFVEVGEHDFMLGNDRQRDLVMARALVAG